MGIADPPQFVARIADHANRTLGTGFLVADDIVVTAAHVVADENGNPPTSALGVTFRDGAAPGQVITGRVEPSWWSPVDASDVAFLRLRREVDGIDVARLASSRDLGPGTKFWSFGFPEATMEEGMLATGDYVGRNLQSGVDALQVRSNELTQGFSGAPIWDSRGVVIGIVITVYDAREDPAFKGSEVAFARPVELLRTLCPMLRLPPAEPYRGLERFDAEHAGLFFGRDADIDRLYDLLVRQDFVAIIGASGSGKSSLVRAGLERGRQISDDPWLSSATRLIITPMQDVDSILAELARQLGAARDQSEDGSVLERIIRDRIHQNVRGPGFLLIVDQFERIFTDLVDGGARQRLLDLLLDLAGANLKVVIALRADFYNDALQVGRLGRAIEGGHLALLPLSEDGLREAISEPASVFNRSFEAGLVDCLVHDVHGAPGQLPLLEFALTELWRADEAGGVLTLDSYSALGGVEGALARVADRVWLGLTPDEKAAAKRVLLSLADASSLGDRSLTSRSVSLREFSDDELNVIDSLVAARLLALGFDSFSGQSTLEVSHEALLHSWPRLRAILQECEEFRMWYQREFAPLFTRWISQNRDKDALLYGKALKEAKRGRQRFPGLLSRPAEEFIEVSADKRIGKLQLAAVGLGVAYQAIKAMNEYQRYKGEEKHTGVDAGLKFALERSKRDEERRSRD